MMKCPECGHDFEPAEDPDVPLETPEEEEPPTKKEPGRDFATALLSRGRRFADE